MVQSGDAREAGVGARWTLLDQSDRSLRSAWPSYTRPCENTKFLMAIWLPS